MAVLFDHGALVPIVMMVVYDRTVVVMLLDGRMRMLDVVTVDVDSRVAGPHVDVLGERTDGGEG
ncbi:hypothetical protein [Methylorubrum extorquens]|uniref:Uncharacterized protein n=2 Tax=Methylorubrum extorquens TaxID=408 RepID=C7CEB3_METED|nr:hypothetical protein [Methylorubrum extorquens]EHP94619.1 hypothetical protein MetexDRAFT_0444 [Methylorubrum extorquens DSM 13060]MCG5248719.1 hypothetical protein [Methylorubrum extorquens]CAX22817.1 protein of unknown function [Methylorubrum extorquens DM4]